AFTRPRALGLLHAIKRVVVQVPAGHAPSHDCPQVLEYAAGLSTTVALQHRVHDTIHVPLMQICKFHIAYDGDDVLVQSPLDLVNTSKGGCVFLNETVDQTAHCHRVGHLLGLDVTRITPLIQVTPRLDRQCAGSGE